MSGWLDQLNINGSPSDPGAWRERLCFYANGALSYVNKEGAEKVNKMVGLKEIERAELVSYPQSLRVHSFVLYFCDKSFITLAARSLGARAFARRFLTLRSAASSTFLSLLFSHEGGVSNRGPQQMDGSHFDG